MNTLNIGGVYIILALAYSVMVGVVTLFMGFLGRAIRGEG